MIKTFSRRLAVLLCCFVFISLAAPVYADAADYPIRQAPLDQENDPNDPDAAQNISGHKLITDHTGFHSIKHLFNKNKFLGSTTEGNASLTLEYPDGIGYLYFIFLL